MQQKVLDLGNAYACWLVESLSGRILSLSSKPGLYPCASVNFCLSGEVVTHSLVSPRFSLHAESKQESDPMLQTYLALTQLLAPGDKSLHTPSHRSSYTLLVKRQCWKGHWKKIGFWKFWIQARFNHWIMLWHDSSLVKPEHPVLTIQ